MVTTEEAAGITEAEHLPVDMEGRTPGWADGGRTPAAGGSRTPGWGPILHLHLLGMVAKHLRMAIVEGNLHGEMEAERRPGTPVLEPLLTDKETAIFGMPDLEHRV